MNIIRYVLDCIELHQYELHWLGPFWYANSSEEVQNLNHRCNVEVHTIHLESSDLDIFLFEFSYPDHNSKYLCHVIRMFYSGFEFVLVVSNNLRILKCSIYFGTNKILQLKDFT